MREPFYTIISNSKDCMWLTLFACEHRQNANFYSSYDCPFAMISRYTLKQYVGQRPNTNLTTHRTDFFFTFMHIGVYQEVTNWQFFQKCAEVIKQHIVCHVLYLYQRRRNSRSLSYQPIKSNIYKLKWNRKLESHSFMKIQP